jgi:hypothetical protein
MPLNPLLISTARCLCSVPRDNQLRQIIDWVINRSHETKAREPQRAHILCIAPRPAANCSRAIDR